MPLAPAQLYPQRSHYIMARARSRHRSPAAPRALYRPAEHPPPKKKKPTRGILVSGRGARGQEAAGNPPLRRRYIHFPASTGPHAASHLASFPPRRRFPARPGGELRSPAPKDKPPGDSDLAGAVGEKAAGGRSGAGQGGREPTPRRPRVTGGEMQEDPRCSPRRRERGVTG